MHKFKGYYFRHVSTDHTFAVIAGMCGKNSFIQIIHDGGSHFFRFSGAEFGKKIIIGNNTFSSSGMHLDLPDIKGDIRYFNPSPIKYDIMGPFRLFPMECRHRVVSMRHSLQGKVSIGEKILDFNGGVGYIEGDSGISFPKKYLWITSNDFADGSSFMLSVAKVPFCGFVFDGVICVLMKNGKEYRLATYLGAKASVKGNAFEVRQHELLIRGSVTPSADSFTLISPKNGRMKGRITEDTHALLEVTLSENDTVICTLKSNLAGYERY